MYVFVCVCIYIYIYALIYTVYTWAAILVFATCVNYGIVCVTRCSSCQGPS